MGHHTPALIDKEVYPYVPQTELLWLLVYHIFGTLLFVARCFGLVTFLIHCNSSLRLLFVQLFQKIDNNTLDISSTAASVSFLCL